MTFESLQAQYKDVNNKLARNALKAKKLVDEYEALRTERHEIARKLVEIQLPKGGG